MASQDFNKAEYDKITAEIKQINAGFELLPTAKTFDMNNNPILTENLDKTSAKKSITDTFNSKEHQDNMEDLTPFHNPNYSISNLNNNSLSSIKENLENKKITISDINEAVS
jgi:hypothetical protein